MKLIPTWVILCCLVYGCSDEKVTDYKDSKGRIIKHVRDFRRANVGERHEETYKDTLGRITKQVVYDSMVRESFELYNEWFVSNSTFCFDALGRRTLWINIGKSYTRSVDSGKIHGMIIDKEKHVYEYPAPDRMVDIEYKFYTRNFNDTDWTIKPTTPKYLSINKLDKKGNEIGSPIYTKEWPARSTSAVDSTQAMESFPDPATGRWITRMIKDTSFNAKEIISSNSNL